MNWDLYIVRQPSRFHSKTQQTTRQHPKQQNTQTKTKQKTRTKTAKRKLIGGPVQWPAMKKSDSIVPTQVLAWPNQEKREHRDRKITCQILTKRLSSERSAFFRAWVAPASGLQCPLQDVLHQVQFFLLSLQRVSSPATESLGSTLKFCPDQKPLVRSVLLVRSQGPQEESLSDSKMDKARLTLRWLPGVQWLFSNLVAAFHMNLTLQDMKIQFCCNWQAPTNPWTASARCLDSFCK